jgi:hypothetical protein
MAKGAIPPALDGCPTADTRGRSPALRHHRDLRIAPATPRRRPATRRLALESRCSTPATRRLAPAMPRVMHASAGIVRAHPSRLRRAASERPQIRCGTPIKRCLRTRPSRHRHRLSVRNPRIGDSRHCSLCARRGAARRAMRSRRTRSTPRLVHRSASCRCGDPGATARQCAQRPST